MKFPSLETLQTARRNPAKRFPSEEDPRFDDGLLFPSLTPKFTLAAPAKVFTIGSCFARGIEMVLANYDIELPTWRFTSPKSEWPFGPQGLLNEYNPGTIFQRILSALGARSDSEETIIETKDGFVDLLLTGGFPVVSHERAVARRSEIGAIYEDLASSDLVVITLGLVEAWFDEEDETFLNGMPPTSLIKKAPDRYSFRRLGVSDSLSLLDRALSNLIEAGVENILLTVSPVPLGTTFTDNDVIAANSFSKSVLRVCAEELKEKYQQVDYFPSFEMVGSGGLSAFIPDNIHVRPEVVKHVTRHMLEAYFPNLAAKSEPDRQAGAFTSIS